MAEASPLVIVGWSAVALLVACWWTAAFAAPGRLRDRAAWIGASALYVALLCLFVSLFLRALANESRAGTFGFGFGIVFFGCGLGLASVRTLRALAGKPGKGTESATH